MNEQARPADRPLKTVRTETLPEGTLFVSPDGVLYQVVMAGSAGFRKAEPWPWPPRGWRSATRKPKAVALVPSSLLARNYPVVAEGRPLPTVSRPDFLDPGGEPTHYIFPTERLAKLAAQLDEKLAHGAGLAVQQERRRCILSDGWRTFRVYHYQVDTQGMEVDLVARFDEEHTQARACEQGPYYWRYIPGWEEALSTPAQTKELAMESAIESVVAEIAEIAQEPAAPPAVKEAEAQAIAEAQPESQPVAEPVAPAEPSVTTPATEELKQMEELEKRPTVPGTPQPRAKDADEEETVAEPESVAPAEPTEPASAPPKKKTKPKASSKRKTTTSRKRRAPAMILSVDIGYGYTKGIGPDGMRFSFPSVIGTAEDILFATDLIRGEEERPVTYGDHGFFYGEQALLQSRIQSTIFDRSRVHDRTYKMLFVATLVEMAKRAPDGTRIKVVTGLPVGFFGDRAEVVKSFEGVYRLTTDRAIKLTVESVFVAPQPFGSLFRELLNDQGKIIQGSIEKGRVGIIDVGTFTTDFVVSDELRYVQRISGSIPIGWSEVTNQVQQALGDLHRLELMAHEVDRAVQAGEVRVRGEPVSLESLIEPAKADIQTAIIARARDLWSEGTQLDMILVSGGGGPQLYDAIRDVYPHARLLDNAFWANAEGFYHFGQRPATFEE